MKIYIPEQYVWGGAPATAPSRETNRKGIRRKQELEVAVRARSFQMHSLVAKQTEIQEELNDFLQCIEISTSERSSDVARILRFIHEQLFDPDLTVDQVKKRCGIRNNNISTRFRIETGWTIREYIEHLRLQAARRLLSGLDAEVYLIAPAVGYHHLETFYRAFRRSFGCTPLEYRQL